MLISNLQLSIYEIHYFKPLSWYFYVYNIDIYIAIHPTLPSDTRFQPHGSHEIYVYHHEMLVFQDINEILFVFNTRKSVFLDFVIFNF